MMSPGVTPVPVLYRGFCIEDDDQPKIDLIVKHKRIQGHWVTGYYVYSACTDRHWIVDMDNQSQKEILPETLCLQESESGRFSGDVCFFLSDDTDSVKGIVRFGKHRSSDSLKREEVSFFIDWQGNSIPAMTMRQDLLFWSKNDKVVWSGTRWDPKSKVFSRT